MRKYIKPSLLLPAIILAAGLYSAYVRVFRGLGASTHLSDRFPWGLWISFDVLCGVALAAGAFMLSAAVYVLHIERFKPLVRSAIVTGFVGYLVAIIGLMFDLGHPYRIWHPLVMWNPKSVMFEISWCVTLYTCVLAMEVSAFIFERLQWRLASRVAHSVTLPLVMLGVVLSTLHQSSLGSLFLAVPYKLYPLWYSPWLPGFFFLSALAVGCAMVIIESFASATAFKMELELELLSDIGRVLVVVLGLYGIARFMDLSDRHVLDLIACEGFERTMFLAEALLATIGPIVLLLMPNVRRNRLGLFMGASMVAAGFMLNRFNVSMTGFIRASGTKYIPGWMEISVTLMMVLLGITLFGLAARYLNLFPMAKPCLEEGQTCLDRPSCCLGTVPRIWIFAVWTAALVLIGNGVRDFRAFQPTAPATDATSAVSPPIRSPSYPNLPADIVFAQSSDSPGPVTFGHAAHLSVTGQCTDCHVRRFTILHDSTATAPARDMHAVEYCGQCHDGTSVSSDCALCHQEAAAR